MSIEVQLAPPSKAMLWSGGILTSLVVLLLAFDGVSKVLEVEPVRKASEQLGLPANTTFGIGVLLIFCTLVYVNPRTAVLGAILLTGYLGGAVAMHVRAQNGAFPVAFSIVAGGLVWLGLILREPRLLRIIFLRQ